jgi:hypothetical protein
MAKEITEQMIKTFYDGVLEGITMYAWWKDGVQYVGTTGKTLEKAIEEINKEEAARLEMIRRNRNCQLDTWG